MNPKRIPGMSSEAESALSCLTANHTILFMIQEHWYSIKLNNTTGCLQIYTYREGWIFLFSEMN